MNENPLLGEIRFQNKTKNRKLPNMITKIEI